MTQVKEVKLESIKVLFLDVDGVLNYDTFQYDFKEKLYPLCDRLLKRIGDIISQVKNCKIVLSSAWRTEPSSVNGLNKQLKKIAKIDINKVYIGNTPVFYSKTRPYEIKSWLDTNQNKKYKILNWCAIDDMDLLSIDLESNDLMTNHFVWSDPEFGISDENVKQIVKILNS